MKFFQFTFTGPNKSLKLFIAAPTMAIARIVARDARLDGYTLADLANAIETHVDDEQANGHFLTSDGWKEISQVGTLIHSVKLAY